MITWLAGVVVCAVSFKWLKWYYAAPRLPFPPGPPPKFILGNMTDMPLKKMYLRFTEWGHQWGGLVHFQTMHLHNFVVNDLEVAKELFDRRSHLYSDRAAFPIITLMGWDFNTLFLRYGERWKAQRRFLQQAYKPEASRKYEPIQAQKVHNMLFQLLTAPERFLSHIRHSSGAIIMSVVYGHDVQEEHDHFVEIAEKALDSLTRGVIHPVNVVNILQYVPEWMPGGGFKRFAREARVWSTKMLNDPWEVVNAKLANGTGRPCMATELLDSAATPEEIYEAKCVCATSYAGGADTSVSAVETFFYAMANFPDAQKKAQEEIDRVVGRDRLPTCADRTKMPYTEALLREVLRWRPPTPIAPLRLTTADDVYDGYRIPKGSNVIINIWAMSRDLSKYDDPEAFDPSRFFSKDGELNADDVAYVFGFGRRACPGKHFALASLWLSITAVLACFDITKVRDADGNEIPVDSNYTGDVLIHPLPFKCSVTPRSEAAKNLILDAEAQQDHIQKQDTKVVS